MTPRRYQRTRKAGEGVPPDAVYVGRPTKWGNPFKIGDHPHPFNEWATEPLDRGEAVACYRYWLTGRTAPDPTELRGKDLVCWCPLEVECHADVLIELANAPQ